MSISNVQTYKTVNNICPFVHKLAIVISSFWFIFVLRNFAVKNT